MNLRNGHDHADQAHIHATVDHLAGSGPSAARLEVRLDEQLMADLQGRRGDLVRITTDRGRSILVRLGNELFRSEGPNIIRLDRFVRQALKAHLNETVEIERASADPVNRLELLPAVDVSMAHDLASHLKHILISAIAPISKGAIYYVPFPGSHAGTTYEAHVASNPGVITEATEIVLHYHDSHLSDGAFDITYEDVGGLAREIKLVRELIQLPLKFPNVYRHLGISPPRGLILYGPPGSGKTHLARAVSNEVEAQFYYINGPDVIGSYTGETESNLRRIFAEASHHAPSVVFIDELDAVAPKRGETGAHSDTRAVTQLLSLMDGLKRVDSVVVIGTTNRIDSVDPAFRRPGRFDREIFVGPPNVEGRREILDIHTREMPLADQTLRFLDEVAQRTHGFLGADLMELCREAGLNAMRRGTGGLEDYRAAFRIPVEELRIEQEDFEAALGLVRPSALREALVTIPEVSWSDIGGLAEVKRRLMEAIEIPLRNPSLLVESGLPPHVGVLLHGPSGVGKTLLARAIAQKCGVNFISVDGPEIFTKWLGESEEGVRQVFRIARQVAPTIIFFDQLDAIAPVRGRNAGSTTADRVVNQLLAELDGVEQLSGVAVIGATNRVDLIDPSILRPGRFGIHIQVNLPDEAARREILRLGLRSKGAQLPQIDSSAIAEVAKATDGFSGAEIRGLCEEAKRMALRRENFAKASAPNMEDLFKALGGRFNQT